MKKRKFLKFLKKQKIEKTGIYNKIIKKIIKALKNKYRITLTVNVYSDILEKDIAEYTITLLD